MNTVFNKTNLTKASQSGSAGSSAWDTIIGKPADILNIDNDVFNGVNEIVKTVSIGGVQNPANGHWTATLPEMNAELLYNIKASNAFTFLVKGGGVNKIYDAVQFATAGSTVFVENSGVIYNESHNLYKAGVKIIGIGMPTINYTGGSVGLFNFTGYDSLDIEFSGFKLIHPIGGYGNFISCNEGSVIEVDNVKFENINFISTNGTSITIKGHSYNAYFRNVYIKLVGKNTNSSTGAISIGYNGNVLLIDGYIKCTVGSPITLFYGGLDIQVAKVTISGVLKSESSAYCLYSHSGWGTPFSLDCFADLVGAYAVCNSLASTPQSLRYYGRITGNINIINSAESYVKFFSDISISTITIYGGDGNSGYAQTSFYGVLRTVSFNLFNGAVVKCTGGVVSLGSIFLSGGRFVAGWGGLLSVNKLIFDCVVRNVSNLTITGSNKIYDSVFFNGLIDGNFNTFGFKIINAVVTLNNTFTTYGGDGTAIELGNQSVLILTPFSKIDTLRTAGTSRALLYASDNAIVETKGGQLIQESTGLLSIEVAGGKTLTVRNYSKLLVNKPTSGTIVHLWASLDQITTISDLQ